MTHVTYLSGEAEL